MKKAMVLYVPVLHNGYIGFLKKYKKETSRVFILDEEFSGEFTSFEKEIRAISPVIMRRLIESLGFETYILTKKNLNIFRFKYIRIISVGDQVSKDFAKKYLGHLNVVFDEK